MLPLLLLLLLSWLPRLLSPSCPQLRLGLLNKLLLLLRTQDALLLQLPPALPCLQPLHLLLLPQLWLLSCAPIYVDATVRAWPVLNYKGVWQVTQDQIVVGGLHIGHYAVCTRDAHVCIAHETAVA
jgi:hypothetical protein